MSKTDYLENKILDHVLRNVAYTSPTTVYMGLFTVAPSDAGGGTEVSGNAYARQAVTFGAAASGSSSNTSAVNFPTATPAGWNQVTHWALFDASSGGNMLHWGALVQYKTIAAGDSIDFPIGNVVVTED